MSNVPDTVANRLISISTTRLRSHTARARSRDETSRYTARKCPRQESFRGRVATNRDRATRWEPFRSLQERTMVRRCVLLSRETERAFLRSRSGTCVHILVHTHVQLRSVPPVRNPPRQPVRRESKEVAVKSRLINHASLSFSLRQDRKAARTGQTRRKRLLGRLASLHLVPMLVLSLVRPPSRLLAFLPLFYLFELQTRRAVQYNRFEKVPKTWSTRSHVHPSTLFRILFAPRFLHPFEFNVHLNAYLGYFNFPNCRI